MNDVLKLRLPEGLHRAIAHWASAEGITVEQFLAAEKLAAVTGPNYLEERARRGSREKYLVVLARAPDVPPDSGDELPPGRQKG